LLLMVFYRSNELSKFRGPSRCVVGSAGPFAQSYLYYVIYVILLPKLLRR